MEIAEVNNFVKRSGKMEEVNFSIKASAKSFSILSDKLYANKIRAIIRELSCNAHDAHIEAKNEEPFLIHLPDSADSNFWIRDFGTGISPEDIANIYTKYFESTKTSSNDFIGALGLGSKTPFCYTDNFQVTSFFDGIKYEYAAFINEEGMPSISLISSEKTEEKNGLMVKFDVSSKDFQSFENEAKYVFAFFKRKPLRVFPSGGLTFAGAALPIKFEQFNGEVDGKNIEFTNFQSSDYFTIARLVVLMGNVPYNISDGALPEKYNDIVKAPGILHVPIGSVEVQASREGISFNKATKEFICKCLDEICKKIEEPISLKIEKCNSYWHACIEYQNIWNNIPQCLKQYYRSIIIPKYKGEKIIFSIPRDYFHLFERELKRTRKYNHEYGGYRKYIYTDSYVRPLDISLDVLFFASSEGFEKSDFRKVKDLLKEKNKKYGICCSFNFIEEIGVDQEFWLDIKNLPKKERDFSSRKGISGKKKTEAWVLSSGKFSTLQPIDLQNEEGIYVELTSSRKVKLKRYMSPVADWEEDASYLSSILDLISSLDLGSSIFGFTKTQISSCGPKWKRLEDVVSKKYLETMIDEKAFSDLTWHVATKSWESSLIDNSKIEILINHLSNDHPLKKEILELSKYKNPQDIVLANFMLNPKIISISQSSHWKNEYIVKLRNDLIKREGDLLKRYSVLNLLVNTFNENSYKEAVIDLAKRL